MSSRSYLFKSEGFTLLELIITISISMLIVAAISIPIFSDTRQVALSTQMEQDLKTLNRSVKMYSANGGRIPENDPMALIDQMKTRRTGEASTAFVGVSGSFMDPRVNLKAVDEGPGFRWDDAGQTFKISETGTRYRVELLETGQVNTPARQTEQRDQSVLQYGAGGWIWNYEDAPGILINEPTPVALTDVEPEPISLSGTIDPPPSESVPPLLEKLAPPVFSIEGGSYDVDDYGLALELTNPNPVGEIIYAIISRPGWEFQTGSGLLIINPGDYVIAYVNSPDPFVYDTSDLTMGKYKGVYYPKPLYATTDEENPVSVEAHPDVVDPDKYEIAFSITGVSPPARGTASFSGGTITFDPKYAFRYLAEGETTTETFNYTVLNTDGSTGTETVTITVTGINNIPAISGDSEMTVHEAGLPSGTGAGPTAITASGALIINDPDASDTLNLIVNGMDVGVPDGNAPTLMATVPGPSGNGELAIHGDGSWTYTLVDNASHDSDDSAFAATEMETFSITVREPSGYVTPPVKLTMNIADDTVTAAPALLSGGNTAGTLLIGTLDLKGADSDPFTSDLTSNISGWDGATATWALSGLTSGWGYPVYYQIDPDQTDRMIGYVDRNLLAPSAYGEGTDQHLAFTLETDPNGDHYQLNLLAGIDSFSNAVVNMSEMEASGPDTSWIFTDEKIYTTSETIPPSATELFTATAANPGDLINKSTVGMGINNMWLDSDEGGLDLDLAHPSREFWLSILFANGKGNQVLNWTAYGVDGSTVIESGTYDAATDGPVLKIKTTSGLFLKKIAIRVTPTTRRWQIGGITVDSMVGDDPVTVSVDVNLNDSDGDETTNSLQFHLE